MPACLWMMLRHMKNTIEKSLTMSKKGTTRMPPQRVQAPLMMLFPTLKNSLILTMMTMMSWT
uniref:Uncharacterized protein n=1 Tax=Cannabis sativa TaxID=3483 RepID=A0A803R4P9_CANSA